MPTPSSLPCRSFEDVFDAVNAGPADYGVLPIENSIGGSIHRNFDLLLEHQLPIVGELEVPVVHHLLALPGRDAGRRCSRIYSHPQALAQCDRFLRTLTGVEIIATYDTAGSAKMIADEQTGRRRGDRLGARGGSVRPGRRCKSAIQDYENNIDPLPRHRPPAAVRRAAPTRRPSCSRWRTSRARCSRR